MVQRAALGLLAGAVLGAGALAQVPEFTLVSRDDSESRVGCDRSKWSGGAGTLYLAGTTLGPAAVNQAPWSEACLAQWSVGLNSSALSYDARPLFVLQDVSEVHALPVGGAIFVGRMRTATSDGHVLYVAKTSATKALNGAVLPDWLATFPDKPLRVLFAASNTTFVQLGSGETVKPVSPASPSQPPPPFTAEATFFVINNDNGSKTEIPGLVLPGGVGAGGILHTFAVPTLTGPALFLQHGMGSELGQKQDYLSRWNNGRQNTIFFPNATGAWLRAYARTSTTMFAYAVADGQLRSFGGTGAMTDYVNLGSALMPGATAMGASPRGAYVATCTSEGSSPTRLVVRRLHINTRLVASFSLAPIVFGTGFLQHKCNQDGLQVDDFGVVVFGAGETFARPRSFTSKAKLVRLASDPADASKLVLTHLSVADDVAISDVAEIRGPAFLGRNLYAMFGARKTVVTFALPGNVPTPRSDGDLDGEDLSDSLVPAPAPASPTAGTSDAQTSPASAAGAAATVLAVAGVVVVAAAVAYRRRRALSGDATRGEIAADPAASL